MQTKHLVFLECIICAVSSGLLPKLDHLKMDAVNTRYLLGWNWTYSTSVNFTAQMAFLNLKHREDSYNHICFGVQTYCDYSAHLDYSGEYFLRVRAETTGQTSDWATLVFCPDRDANLGAPSQLKVEPGVSMVTVSFKEPMAEKGEPMSSVLSQNSKVSAMAFRLRFWTDDAPSQRQEKKIATTLHTLSLPKHTGYCFQVQAFSDDFGKTSPYTPPQCTTTLGPNLLWHILLPLGLLAILAVCGILWTKNRRRMSLPYAVPSSMALHFKSPQALVVPQESTSAVTVLVAGLPTAEQLSPSWDGPTPTPAHHTAPGLGTHGRDR